ncbi:hypothetical protein QFZ75_002982 [Streptomyces sp. V3I8]|uniref:hypothetical protein n=1 Tax=Streptomyces sp. V3I8 TaxID=3042279 RepID=UPI0027804F63|nr:hypothetical protein [Streptomyces sp. V3I8]MDQ1036566.1 hypothetical protein [Streptomyces sp. V3I8]
MADERCVFPGDGPRAPGRWLDRDTAERLLRGEPLETADAGVRAQADRLSGAFDALIATTAGTPSADTELPGEEAALAAFRTARTGRDGKAAGQAEPTGQAGRAGQYGRTGQPDRGPHARTNTVALPRTPAPGTSLDAGLVRLGGPGRERRVPSLWGRPVRYGLAAALAAGMIGGVAAAATAGVLAFGGEEPESGASATAAVTPDRPSRTPSPAGTDGDDPRSGGAGAPTAGGAAPSAGAEDDTDPGTGTQPGSEDSGRAGRPGQRSAGLAAACRDHRDGEDLAPGRRRTLEDAAHGAAQVDEYCKGLLKNGDRKGSDDDWSGVGSGRGGRSEDGDGRNGDGGQDGQGGGAGGGAGAGAGGDGKDRGGDRGHTGPGTFKGDRGGQEDQGGRGHRAGVTFSAVPTQY